MQGAATRGYARYYGGASDAIPHIMSDDKLEKARQQTTLWHARRYLWRAISGAGLAQQQPILPGGRASGGRQPSQGGRLRLCGRITGALVLIVLIWWLFVPATSIPAAVHSKKETSTSPQPLVESARFIDHKDGQNLVPSPSSAPIQVASVHNEPGAIAGEDGGTPPLRRADDDSDSRILAGDIAAAAAALESVTTSAEAPLQSRTETAEAVELPTTTTSANAVLQSTAAGSVVASSATTSMARPIDAISDSHTASADMVGAVSEAANSADTTSASTTVPQVLPTAGAAGTAPNPTHGSDVLPVTAVSFAASRAPSSAAGSTSSALGPTATRVSVPLASAAGVAVATASLSEVAVPEAATTAATTNASAVSEPAATTTAMLVASAEKHDNEVAGEMAAAAAAAAVLADALERADAPAQAGAASAAMPLQVTATSLDTSTDAVGQATHGALGDSPGASTRPAYPSLETFSFPRPEWGPFHAPLPPTWAFRPGAPTVEARAAAASRLAVEDARSMPGAHIHRSRGVFPTLEADVQHRARVADAIGASWTAYAAHAFGADLLRPLSKGRDDAFLGMGATLVDAMSTLAIAGRWDDFDRAAAWVDSSLQFKTQVGINTFETTIRVLGGLLSAWHLDGRRNAALLRKAVECADALAPAFASPSGLPYGTLDLTQGRAYNPGVPGSSVSEVATLQLELEALSAATGDPKYAIRGRRAMAALLVVEPVADSLLPMYISPDSGDWVQGGTITLGARGDSAYEYMLKQALMAGALDVATAATSSPERGFAGNTALINSAGLTTADWAPSLPAARAAYLSSSVGADAQALSKAYSDASAALPGTVAGIVADPQPSGNLLSDAAMLFSAGVSVTADTEAAWFRTILGLWDRAAVGIETRLIRRTRPAPAGFTFVAERLADGRLDGKMDHLVCFLPGALGLASALAPTPALASEQLSVAEDLLRTCIRMYTVTATGIAPEISRFEEGGADAPGAGDPSPDAGAAHNLLRPETAESLFVLYRLTGKQEYRDAGAAMLDAWDRYSAVPGPGGEHAGGGYATLRDVRVVPPPQDDKQESFWLAETLKYLFLLFSDSDSIRLDEWVFNTEAHPLPIWGGDSVAPERPT